MQMMLGALALYVLALVALFLLRKRLGVFWGVAAFFVGGRSGPALTAAWAGAVPTPRIRSALLRK